MNAKIASVLDVLLVAHHLSLRWGLLPIKASQGKKAQLTGNRKGPSLNL